MDKFLFVKYYFIKKNGVGYFKFVVDLEYYNLKCIRCDEVFFKFEVKFKVILECEKCVILVFWFVCLVCGYMEYC